MEVQTSKSFEKQFHSGNEIGSRRKTTSCLRMVFDNLIGKLLTVKELAVVLCVSERTVRDWVLKDRIPVIRINGCVRFEPLTIAEWLAERSENS